MSIVLIVFAVIVLITAGFVTVKLLQLKKLYTQSADELLASVSNKEGIYVSVAIIENGETTYRTYSHDNAEPERTDLQFEIGSATKTMTALLTAKAVNEGKININDSIDKYLDLPAGKYYPTIARILTHTSGYKGDYYDKLMVTNYLHGDNTYYNISKDSILERVKKVKLEDKDYPFKYSNFGISVVGLVLEAIYDTDYTALLTSYLQNDLEMKDTSVATSTGNLSGYWKWNSQDAYVPAGAVISDIKDMSKYMHFYMESEEDYVKMPFQDLKTVNAASNLYNKMGIYMDNMGMTWIHDTTNHFYWHNGGTSKYNSSIAISEDFRKSVVILSNYGPNENIPVFLIGVKLMQEKAK